MSTTLTTTATGPHCENCGARVDPQVVRVCGTDGTVPVCGTGDGAESLSHSGVSFDSTVRAVAAFYRRELGGADQ